MRVFLVILILAASFLYAAQSGVVKRDRAIVRSGPGSFYEIQTELAKGTNFDILEETKGWYRIELVDAGGYISSKVTEEKQSGDDIFSKMGQKPEDLKISQYGMSAGVKGFAERFSKTFKGDQDFLGFYLSYRLDIKAFKEFHKETYRNFSLKKVQKEISIPASMNKNFFSQAEEGLGIGIASQIASLGIYHDRELTEYINQVGNLIVDASDAYDIGFKFFILDSEMVNGYACPGGIVFITKGLLKLIQSEAELACVLAHEIAHVARHHGMLEMAERKHQIAAESAFEDLEAEMGAFEIVQDQKFREVEQEMEDLSFQIFENLINGRLQQYEKEADELAVIYSARAGYNGRDLLNILSRLKNNTTKSTNEHYTQKQIEERIGWLKDYLIKINLPQGLFDQKTRWIQKTRF